MDKKQLFELLPISVATQESTERVMNNLRAGMYLQHCLKNAAIPFAEKQNVYLISYKRMLLSKNYRYILESRGNTD